MWTSRPVGVALTTGLNLLVGEPLFICIHKTVGGLYYLVIPVSTVLHYYTVVAFITKFQYVRRSRTKLWQSILFLKISWIRSN